MASHVMGENFINYILEDLYPKYIRTLKTQKNIQPNKEMGKKFQHTLLTKNT